MVVCFEVTSLPAMYEKLLILTELVGSLAIARVLTLAPPCVCVNLFPDASMVILLTS